MNKILTISIAAYNVGKYIKETLNSLCVNEIIDDIEVFVVDDGGSDDTLLIAKEFANKYPQSIFPIHKENGGWGSTVNYSIEHATGKYFRLLDGDDFFAKEGFISYISELKKLDVDVVYTPYRRFDDKTYKTIEKFYSKNTQAHGKVININECDADFVMHSSTFRTRLLQENKISVLEHCFYTDNEYRTKALAYARTAIVLDYEVYQYRVGREGQSVDIRGLQKHYVDNLRVTRELLNFCNTINSQNNPVVKECTKSSIRFHYNALILLEKKDEIIKFDEELKSYGDDFYNINDVHVNKLRKTNFRDIRFYKCLRSLRQSIGYRIKKTING